MRAHHGEGVGITHGGFCLRGVKICLHILHRVPPELGRAVEWQFAFDFLILIDGHIDAVAFEILKLQCQRGMAFNPALFKLGPT